MAASGADTGRLDRLPMRTPFVGRGQELAFLHACLDGAWGGQGGRFVLVSGPAGVGKTRLLHELGGYALGRGGRCLYGRYPREVAAPHAAWKEAFGPVLDELTRADPGSMPALRAHLAAVFPEHVGSVHDVEPPGDADERRTRQAEALAGLTAVLASRGPLLLLLDDVQWADDLIPLVLLSGPAHRLPVLVVAAIRSDELGQRHAVARGIHELGRARSLAELPLRCLDQHDTTAMLAHNVGTELASDLAGVVYATTRGNPFFVEEVLRSMADDGVVASSGDAWVLAAPRPERLQLPDSVRALIWYRIDRLGEVTRTMLDRAAVLGQEFSFRLLEAMSPHAEHQLAAGRTSAARPAAARPLDGR